MSDARVTGPYQAKPPAHPNTKPIISAPATRQTVRIRLPSGFNNARTSSRQVLEKSRGFSVTRDMGAVAAGFSDCHLDSFQGIRLVHLHDRIPCGSPMIMLRTKSIIDGE
jgi:hypothetical protein